MYPRVSVIIPVYKAFPDAVECLKSVVQHSPWFTKIILVDDCSPEGEFKNHIPRLLRLRGNIKLVRNPKNLGFVGSCNLGMKLAGSDDVVLLNSDTIVTPRWLNKLQAAAYSRKNIGTVTPLTNNGTIASFPTFCQDNELPKDYSLNQFAELVESVSVRQYIELPTAVGFCMYIKRALLDVVGLFDEQAFGKGYGEENDLSLRGQAAGFVDVLDDATYVFHKGSLSFKEDKIELCKTNTETLVKRYPDYMERVATFCRNFPLLVVHARILDEMVIRWNRSRKRNILHILHNGPYEKTWHGLGGTELLVQELIEADSDTAHWSLVPVKSGYQLTAHLAPIHRSYFRPAEAIQYSEVINKKYFDIVHLHHPARFNYPELVAALNSHGKYFVSVHDFQSICPRSFLMTPKLSVCNGTECASSCGFEMSNIEKLRADTQRLLASASRTITFSPSVVDYMTRYGGVSARWHIMPHGIKDQLRTEKDKFYEVGAPTVKSPLKIAFVGHLVAHKGSSLINELVGELSLANGIPLEWHVVGNYSGPLSPNLYQHGEFTRGNLSNRLKEIRPHIVAILSVCPETYSMTLDESWNAGVPVLSTPHGAPAERVLKSDAGWVLPELSKAAVLAKLMVITGDWASYEYKREKINNLKLISVEEETRQLHDLYTKLVKQGDVDNVVRALSYLEGRVWQSPRSAVEKLLLRIRRYKNVIAQTLNRQLRYGQSIS